MQSERERDPAGLGERSECPLRAAAPALRAKRKRLDRDVPGSAGRDRSTGYGRAMGLFDKAREAAEALAAQQTAGGLAAVDAELPPDAPRVRIDRIAVEAGRGPATLARYIGVVGLQPEDVYSVMPQLNQQTITLGYDVVYRDRPEYETGRQRWAAADR